MNRILVVGGAGYIGGYLTDTLNKKHDVTVFDNLMYENRYLKRNSFIYGDIRDRKKMLEIIPDFDTIVWLAAIVGDGACAVDPFLTQSINSDSVKWLVDNFPNKKIIFTSTCSVYGVNNDLIDEETKPNPISIYAETKLEAEQYIVQNHNNYLIFRLGTLFGLGDEHSRIRFDLVANVLTKKASLNQPITVFGGEQWRPLLHVRDVSTAIDFGIDNNINGLYNLSYGNYIIKDIAQEIKKCIPDAEIVYQDMQFEDMRNYKVKNDKYIQFGWKPQFSIQDGIKELKTIVDEKRVKKLDDPIYSNEGYLNKNYFKI